MGKEQLCWKCRRASGTCQWSRWGEPIEGWTATEVDYAVGEKTYSISACPQFEPDELRERIILPGERVSLAEISEMVKVERATLKRMKDDKLIELAQKHGIEIFLKRKSIRLVFAKAPINAGLKDD